jgi:hypothetical protein
LREVTEAFHGRLRIQARRFGRSVATHLIKEHLVSTIVVGVDASKRSEDDRSHLRVLENRSPTLRVVAYAGPLRDESPPFRLDR